MQSLKSTDTFQPAGSLSSEPIILGINVAPLEKIFLNQGLLNQESLEKPQLKLWICIPGMYNSLISEKMRDWLKL